MIQDTVGLDSSESVPISEQPGKALAYSTQHPTYALLLKCTPISRELGKAIRLSGTATHL